MSEEEKRLELIDAQLLELDRLAAWLEEERREIINRLNKNKD